MYRYTANGNYNVREDFGVSVFDKELTLDQKNQRNDWTRVEAALQENNKCLSYHQEPSRKCTWKDGKIICKERKCTWINETKKCTLDNYKREICDIKKECQEGGSELSYCKKRGPMCNSSSKAVEDMCCNKKTTHFGFINENGNKKK